MELGAQMFMFFPKQNKEKFLLELELPFSTEVCIVKLCTGKNFIMAQHINAFTSEHCTKG